MTPRHHPPEELLLGYASGEISEPMALVVASHLAFCSDCRDAVTQAEAFGGALLEDLPVESFSASHMQRMLEQTLDRAARHPLPDRVPRKTDATAGLLPQPLRDYVGNFDAVRWRSLGSGIQHHVVAKNRHGAVARLLKVAPGRSVFEHQHAGTELTLVLQGAYRAGGTHFARGDVECADETTKHRPIASIETTCICLAVTDGPLRFSNIVGRLIQPFLDI
jgi:putative transcriptional regulator